MSTGYSGVGAMDLLFYLILFFALGMLTRLVYEYARSAIDAWLYVRADRRRRGLR